jgi:hypothetical protein
MAAIEVSKLKRAFKATLGVLKRKTKIFNAVDGISFEVQKGELFGLLGPNEAGKTTTVKMLTTLLILSSGSARIAEMDIVRDAEKIRLHIGFIFSGECWSGALPYLFGTPANQMALFLGRAFMHIFDGMLSVFIGSGMENFIIQSGPLPYRFTGFNFNLPHFNLHYHRIGSVNELLKPGHAECDACYQLCLFFAPGLFRSLPGIIHPSTLDAGGIQYPAAHSRCAFHPCPYRWRPTGRNCTHVVAGIIDWSDLYSSGISNVPAV